MRKFGFSNQWDTDHPELVEFEGETLGDTLTNLLAEVKRLTASLEETNHHLDLMVERFGIEALVEMIGDD